MMENKVQKQIPLYRVFDNTADDIVLLTDNIEIAHKFARDYGSVIFNNLSNGVIADYTKETTSLFKDKLVYDFLRKYKWLVIVQVVGIIIFILSYNHNNIFEFFAEHTRPSLIVGKDSLKTVVKEVSVPTKDFSNMGSLLMIIGGIIGVIGGVRVYNKWCEGDQDVESALLGWGGITIFLLLSPIIIEVLF